MSPMRATALGALALLLVCLVAYGPVLGAGFVYDDHRFIVHNESIRSLDLGGAFTNASTASHGEGIQHDIYRPLRTVFFMLEWAAFGGAPGPWHVVSVLLHVLVGVLLWRWLVRLVPGHAIATWLAATAVMVHPVTLESVAWVSSQGDLLAAALSLAALLLWARPGKAATLGGTACFALACLAKESALALPALLVFQEAVFAKQRGQPWLQRALFLRVGLCVAVLAVYLLVRHTVLGVWAQVDDPLFDVTARARGMLAGLAWYAETLAWPDAFTFDYRFDLPVRWSDPRVVLGLGMLVGLLWAALAMARRGAWRGVLVALGVLALLVPVSNVIVPLKTFVADRFLYPVLLPLALGLALGLLGLARRLGIGALAAGGALVLGLLVITHGRADAWQSDQSLWEAVRADQPNNANAYYGLAYEHARAGRVREAYRYFESYIAANPVDGKAWMLLGDTFGDLAQSLYLAAAAEGAQTDIALRRRQAGVMQVQCYRKAADIWSRYGFARGRGSPAMMRTMLMRWFRIAVEIGDVAEARRANNATLVRAGVDPENAEEVDRQAPWPAIARRWFLARMAIDSGLPRGLPHGERDVLLRQRAQVLVDVGLDPRKPSGDLARAYVPAFEQAMVRARARGERIDADALLNLARALIDERRFRDAQARIAEARAVRPRHPRLREVESYLRTVQESTR